MPEPVKGKGRYMAGLDGLRAVAVIAVIAYHLNLGWAPGGLLGVGVFFVLSGYLITDLITTEWRQNKRIDLKDFWLRRARRLLPALFLMLAAVLVWVTLHNPFQLFTLRGDLFAALLYVSNWWLIYHHVSYFVSFGPPSPLGHLWSLAVEEQFYLVWPLALSLGLRCWPQRWRFAGVTLALATASALAMALLYQPGTDPSRVYYGTDTRAFGLLTGAVLALVWPSRKLSTPAPAKARLSLDLVGAIGLLAIIFMFWKTNQYEAFLYRGGLVALSAAAAATVAAVAHPGSRLGKILGWKPLRWLGVRSYGIYLWHYPVIILTNPSVNTGGVDVPRAILQVLASIILAAVSWRFVEEPIRRGAAGKLWGKLRHFGGKRRSLPRRWISVGALLVLCIPCAGLAWQIPAVTASSDQTRASVRGTESSPPLPTLQSHEVPPKGTGTGGGSAGRSGNDQIHTGARKTSGTGAGPKTATVARVTTSATYRGVTAIGDSVLIDVAPYLKKLVPGIVIDGKVSRQMVQAPEEVAALKSKGRLGSTVVIELGTNGPFTRGQLESILRSLGSVRHIVLVNTRVPRPWEGVVNATLAQVAATFPHTTLVNWNAKSAGKNGYFYPDGVHLNPEGSRFYASLLTKAIQSVPQNR